MVHRAILVEKSVNLGHGGFVGAPATSGSKGNHNSGGSKKPSSGGSYPSTLSGGSGSNSQNF